MHQLSLQKEREGTWVTGWRDISFGVLYKIILTHYLCDLPNLIVGKRHTIIQCTVPLKTQVQLIKPAASLN